MGSGPSGPHALTRSLPALLSSLPRRACPAPAAAAPFVSRTGLSRSHGPPPPPPPPRTRPAPSPQTCAAPDPSVPASAPASRRLAPHPLFPLLVPSTFRRRALLAPHLPSQGCPGPRPPSCSGILPTAPSPALGPAFRPLPGAVPDSQNSSLPGGIAFDGDQEGAWSPVVSRGPARGPHSGLCAAPFPMPCLTPSRLRPASQGLLGPQRPSSCLRAHQPRLGPLHQLQGGGLLSVGSLGREPQQKAYGSAGGGTALRPSWSAGWRGRRWGSGRNPQAWIC